VADERFGQLVGASANECVAADDDGEQDGG
jgi:hypothetical protein